MKRDTHPGIRRRSVLAGAVGTALLAATSACGSDDSGSAGLTTVKFAMDYLPGPAHNGLAYAMQQGLFEKRGIKVQLLPYTDSPPDALIAAGTADLGLNWGATYALSDFAQGMPVKSVFVLYQHYPAALGVLKDSAVTRPADMAGRKLGTFGDPIDPATANTMIAADGGSGKVQPVVVGTSVYQALSGKEIDGFLIYASDQYEFEKSSGDTLRTYSPTKFGVPDSYGNLVLANTTFLTKKPQVAKDFLAAFTEGYQKSLTDLSLTNDALEKQFPGKIDRALVDYVTKIQNSYLFIDADGGVGTQKLDRWQATWKFMTGNGLLVDAKGKALSADFDPATFITDEYLPKKGE
jgi:ABC-type nitrate/sulfonate/bicarbonate transport system substrate-binding protein